MARNGKRTEVVTLSRQQQLKICLKPLFQIISSSCISRVSVGHISHPYSKRGKQYVLINLSNIISSACFCITDLILLKHPKYFCLAAFKSILKFIPDIKYSPKYFTLEHQSSVLQFNWITAGGLLPPKVTRCL